MSAVSRENAWTLLNEYTKSESLIKHALCVEAAMSFYARHFKEDEELWSVTGLIHDFDYEKYPEPTNPGGHPFVGAQIMRDRGYPEEVITAVLGHANYSGVPRESLLARALFACDELSGLVYASVLVRPDRSIHTLETPSVKKKMKDKAFAKGVNRDDVINGAKELQIELEAHINNVILALRERATALGIAGLPS